MKNPLKLKIEIGGFPILIELNDYKIFQGIKAFYRPFITGRNHLYKIKVDIKNGSKKAQDIEGVFSSYSNRIYKVKAGEFEGFLDFKKNSGKIHIFSLWPVDALISVLENISIFVIMKKGGIVFHASGIVRDEKAYIFFGPSGSGKSTIAEASCRYGILSEELIGIQPESKSFKAFAIPCKTDARFPKRLNSYFRIAGIFKLVRDRRNYLKPIPKPRALADFFMLPSSFKHLISYKKFFNRHHRLIKEVPCFELHFLPDSSFWKCIEDNTAKVERLRSWKR